MADSVVVGALRVLLSMNAAEFQEGIARAQNAIQAWSRDMERVGRRMTQIGTGLTQTLTLPIAAIGTVGAKAAMDFESSFAGVRKTVDATETEFEQMSRAFRNLAKEIPVNVNELNRLGEAAGALGIPKEEIVDFARVMAELGVTTNVTADQAAESIAQIQTQFQAAGKETDNFASTLVHLGNNGASTEAQILALTTRLASAGNAANMSQAEVLGWAAAMANVGIEAEAGGTAMSRTFNEINAAVAKGGEGLDAFAKIAGMSSEEFARTFRDDASSAVEAFVLGLGRVKDEGGNLVVTLEELGITEIRQSDTLRRLAQNTDNVTKSLNDASVGWSQNSALTEEARKRFATTESQLSLLWNRLKDVAITFGNALLPVIQLAVQALDQLIPVLEKSAQWFGQLPIGLQATIVGISGLAAAIGPLLYVGGTLISTFSAMLPVFTAVGGWLATAVGLFGGVVTAIGGLAIAWATFKGDWVRAFDVLIPPLGLFRLAMDQVSVVWAANKTKILGFVTELYTGIKTWLLDKFNAVVAGITGAINSIGEKFKWLKDVVVGNSYVPDMVDMIADQFLRLDDVMVKQTATSTEAVGGLFDNMLSGLTSRLPSGLGGIIGQFAEAFKGSSGISGSATSMATTVTSKVLGMIPLVGPFLSQFAGPLVDGFKKIGSALKNMFGGPNAAELAGREVVEGFEKNIAAMLTEAQLLEAGNESWKKTVIGIRDAYIAQGLSEQDALKAAEQLWNSSKAGAEESKRIVEEITNRMRGFGTSVAAAFREFPTEINIPINFEVGEVPNLDIPHLATGGIVTRPTVALIGESGPEAVVPLSGGGGLVDGGGRLGGLIDRLEHTLPIAIRDAVLMAR